MSEYRRPRFGEETDVPIPVLDWVSVDCGRFELIGGALEDCRAREPGANRIRVAAWVEAYLRHWEALRSPESESRHIRDLKSYVALARHAPQRYEVFQTYDGEETKLSDAIAKLLGLAQ